MKGLFQLQRVTVKVLKKHIFKNKNNPIFLLLLTQEAAFKSASNQGSYPNLSIKKKLSATTLGKGIRVVKKKDTPQIRAPENDILGSQKLLATSLCNHVT